MAIDFFAIDNMNGIQTCTEMSYARDEAYYNGINYFNGKQFAKQVALHQLLYRKLLKFAYDNECEDTAEWDEKTRIGLFTIIIIDTNLKQIIGAHFTEVMYTSRLKREPKLPLKKSSNRS